MLAKILPPVLIGPVRRALWCVGLLLVFLLVVEVVGLLILRSQVDRYRKYWQTQMTQDQGEVLYLALGDSAAQGIGATSPRRAYVGLVAEHIESTTGKSVKLVNLSVTGATLEDGIRDQLPQLVDYSPDFITAELGANDIKDFEPTKFRREFKQFIDGLPDGAYVADMPDFGTGPLVEKAEAASTIAREELGKQPRLNFVPLEATTKANFNHWLHYAPDFFHPNNWGYKVWASAFKSVITKS